MESFEPQRVLDSAHFCARLPKGEHASSMRDCFSGAGWTTQSLSTRSTHHLPPPDRNLDPKVWVAWSRRKCTASPARAPAKRCGCDQCGVTSILKEPQPQNTQVWVVCRYSMEDVIAMDRVLPRLHAASPCCLVNSKRENHLGSTIMKKLLRLRYLIS